MIDWLRNLVFPLTVSERVAVEDYLDVSTLRQRIEVLVSSRVVAASAALARVVES